MDILLVTFASMLAGFANAIVGGGGLILVPALFAVYPTASPVTLLGTNKSTTLWGFVFAGWRYSQCVQIRWRVLLPAIVLTMVSAFLGAWMLTFVSPALLRKALPVLLVLGYTLVKKDLGQTHAPRFTGRQEVWATGAVACLMGFYDGFFGPGSSSFLLFAFIRWLGYDFMQASASTKIICAAASLAGMVLLASKGYVWWHLVVPLAVANVLGSLLGTHLVLKHGSGFVRKMFIVVVSGLIFKTSYDVY